MHRRVVVCVIVVALVATIAAGQATSVDDVEDLCQSTTTRKKLATLALRVKPVGRIVMYEFEGNAPRIEIDCLQLIDIGFNDDVLCNSPSTVYLCWTDPTKIDWICESLAMYRNDPRQRVTKGSVNGPDLRWRVEYDAAAKAQFCFPRDVKLSFIATTAFAVEGSVALIIIFIVVLVLITIIVLAFGGYQFRKTLSKIFRKTRLGAAYTEQQLKTDPSAMEMLNMPFVQQIPDEVPMLLHEGRAMYVPPPLDDHHGDDSARRDKKPRGFSFWGTDHDDIPEAEPVRPHEISVSKDTFRPSGYVEMPEVEKSVYYRSIRSPPRPRDVVGADSLFLAATAQHNVIPPHVLSRMTPGRQVAPDGSFLLTPQGRSAAAMFSPTRNGAASPTLL